MKSEVSAGLAVLGLALIPLTSHAADKPPEVKIERAKEIPDDSGISSRIKAEFARDKTVSALNINVDTSKGVVRLSGTTRSRQEADRAAAIAKSAPGVSSVKNDIQIAK
jgi:hyperosmotically inducible periplasmic protein